MTMERRFLKGKTTVKIIPHDDRTTVRTNPLTKITITPTNAQNTTGTTTNALNKINTEVINSNRIPETPTELENIPRTSKKKCAPL
jgi:hypothetical protein